MTGDGQVDHYAVLGVAPDASTGEIRRAYRRLAREYHPDVSPDPAGAGRFAAAARSYEVLSDPAARARYERGFARSVPSHPTPGTPPRPPGSPTACRRGVLELTAREAAHVARFPLILTDPRGIRITVPAGTADGDRLILRDGDRRIILRVRIRGDA